jgi:hypothetical protein
MVIRVINFHFQRRVILGSETKGKSYLIVDINNQTTKAVMIECHGEGCIVKGMATAPTTVDSPDLDVTVGIEKAASSLGGKLGRRIWGEGGPSEELSCLCSSSTSGGLYMMVAGLIRRISAESAQRAALGAGALLMDIYSIDDSRPSYKLVDTMRSTKPDMFLLAGGTDGGAESQVLDMAGLIDAADVKPRFGRGYKLPIIYAGNVDVRERVTETLTEDKYATRVVDNVRPLIDRENLGPAREGIYDSYMEHVIVHSPGYEKLIEWVEGDIIPTQAAIGRLLYAYAMERSVNMLAVDIGGATTDVYSVYGGVFNRSLNADIGMTYGISNIMKEAGVHNVMRWIPEEIGEKKVRNIVGNIMILQPDTLTPEEAMVQQAAAREAIRLGLEQHRKIATRLKGVALKRTLADMFDQALEVSILDLMKTQSIICRGKIFDERHTAEDSTLLILDSIQPEGVTEILVDRSSIMPHLGMLLEKNREASLQILSDECLHRLGTCIAPKGRAREGQDTMRIQVSTKDSVVSEEIVTFGELKSLTLAAEESVRISVTPSTRFDVGTGRGKELVAEVRGGEIGLIIDARGRPLGVPDNIAVLRAWAESLTMRPEILTA